MKRMKCVCGKIVQYNPRLKFSSLDIDGWKCSCGKVYYNPETAERILLLNKLKRFVARLWLKGKLSETNLKKVLRKEEIRDLEFGKWWAGDTFGKFRNPLEYLTGQAKLNLDMVQLVRGVRGEFSLRGPKAP